jgi:hypothetical protein
MDADASATYRGYRKQALYVLARVLTDEKAESRVYVPEGAEDLAIYDLEQQMIESVQVKDYASPLALSNFKPSSVDGFFARLQARRHTHLKCENFIASFGELGPELKGAIEGEEAHREKVVKKLTEANSAIGERVARELLGCLKDHVTRPEESALQAKILKYLGGTIAGAYADRSLELLLYWTYMASEERRAITRPTTLLQLQRIGEYLAALRDSSSEWMSTIRPVTTVSLERDEVAHLREEYNRGVQARWSHIVAGLDGPRPTRLAEVHAQLQIHPIVVIRGASGQGKSTLGWRYLHDYSTDGLRFEVRLVEGREHALRVANALRAHILQLRLKAVVWFDVAPSDSGWTELLRDLVDAGIKVLVAIREEDYRRSDLIGGQIAFGEVILDSVNPSEAEAVYAQLSPSRNGAVLDFADAWAKFGGSGPLLEFTHLVTQGSRLAKVLDHQLQRLADEAIGGSGRIGPQHLRALSLGSIVHAAGCRVDSARLCQTVGLDPALRPLSYLEEEYLLRVSDTGVIAGLHALRSQAISLALLKDAPQTWPNVVIAALPLVLDEDLETFLHFVFSHRPASVDVIVGGLAKFPLRTWTQAGGIARALLWVGVSRYEQENNRALAGLVEKYDSGWTMFCDSFVGGGEAALLNLRQIMADMMKTEIPFVELTPKTKLYEPLREWLAQAAGPLDAPVSVSDWRAIGDIAYWSGNRAMDGAIPQYIKGHFPDTLPEGLEPAELGLVVSGLHSLDSAAFIGWHERHAATIETQFLQQTGSIHLEDDGHLVTVVFPIAVLDGGEPDGTGERRALTLLRQVHDLFPHRPKIATHSIGSDFLQGILSFDPTSREVDVTKFVSNRVAGLNGLFGNLVTYRHSRRATWKEYADTVFILRSTVSDAFRGLYRGWAQLISQSRPEGRTISSLPGAALGKIKGLAERPALPKSAVDEWGYLSESRDDLGTSKKPDSALQRFKAWRKAFGDYASAVNNCVQPSVNETAIFAVAKAVDRTQPIDPDGGRLLLSNLGQAWLALPNVQREFRRHFGSLLKTARLDELERNEQSNFRHLWSVAFWLVREPRRTASNPVNESERRIQEQQQAFLDALQRYSEAALGEQKASAVRLQQVVADGHTTLVLVCDHRSLQNFGAANEALVPVLWKAAHDQSWRPFEWIPIAVAFQELVVVHLFRGRLLTAAGVRHNVHTLFLREDRAAAPHELLSLPIDPQLLAQAGISIETSPLVTAMLRWQGALGVFTISLARLNGLLALLDKYTLTEETLNGAAAHFSKETTGTLNSARRTKEALCDLLKPMAAAGPPGAYPAAVNWLERVNTLTSVTLLSQDDETSITVDIDKYVEWVKEIAERAAQIDALVGEIIEAFG